MTAPAARWESRTSPAISTAAVSFTRDGGRWGIGQVHRILTRTTYIGRHEFNKRSKTKELKPVGEIVPVEVPALINPYHVRRCASALAIAQSEGDAGACGQRPDPAHRLPVLCHMCGRHDAANRQG